MKVLIDLTGKEFTSNHGEINGRVQCGVYSVQCMQTGKKGYCDLNHVVRIPFNYDSAWAFDPIEGCARVMQDDKYGLISIDGSMITKCEYDSIGYICHGRIKYKKKDLYGFLDRFGRPVIDPQFAYAQDFRYGLSVVQYPNNEECYYYIDTDGNKRIGPLDAYDIATSGFHDFGIAVVEKPSSCALINHNGKVIVKSKTEILKPYSPWAIEARNRRGELYFIDYSMKIINNTIYDDIRTMSGTYAKVYLNGQWTILDGFAEEFAKLPSIYEPISVTMGLLLVKKDKYYHILDMKGKTILSNNYTRLSDFAEGYAKAETE